jgi:RNA polymerase sigma-70 factor, ECF subfamily
MQTMINVHRRHLGVKMRSASREFTHDMNGSMATSETIAAHFVGHLTSPSQAAIRAELIELLERALEALKPMDREVLALRHFEDLTNQEIAEVLGIQATTASLRYVRAISRLKEVLERIPGFLTSFP